MITQHPPVVIGIDVGSESVRAGIFDPSGTMVSYASHPLTLFYGPAGFVEQSADEIWAAVCHCVKNAVTHGGVSPERVAGTPGDPRAFLSGKNQPLPVFDELAG